MTAHIAHNLAHIHAQIRAACQRSGRDAAEVTLVAVSKQQPSEAIRAAWAAGVRHFGENRIEEAAPKISLLREDATFAATWHMIGHIQSRKAKLVAPLFDVVHSVDSLKVATRLAVAALEQDRSLPVLLEMNVSGEAQKDGFAAVRWREDRAEREALWEAVQQIAGMPGLTLRGLMTMAPFVEDAEETRPTFQRLRQLRDELAATLALDLPELSMGMTNDYPVAVEEGATLVRIGRAVFEPNLDENA